MYLYYTGIRPVPTARAKRGPIALRRRTIKKVFFFYKEKNPFGRYDERTADFEISIDQHFRDDGDEFLVGVRVRFRNKRVDLCTLGFIDFIVLSIKGYSNTSRYKCPLWGCKSLRDASGGSPIRWTGQCSKNDSKTARRD